MPIKFQNLMPLMKWLWVFLVVIFPVLSNAQICKPESIPATTPVFQFKNNGDGTVTDTKTGLMWKRCGEGQVWNSVTDGCDGSIVGYTWKAALEQVQAINNMGGFAGYTDWHLPNVKELQSIVERQCYSPAINLTIFPNTSNTFWTSSIILGYGSRYQASIIEFSNGDGGSWHLDKDKDNYHFGSIAVRLVREIKESNSID